MWQERQRSCGSGSRALVASKLNDLHSFLSELALMTLTKGISSHFSQTAGTWSCNSLPLKPELWYTLIYFDHLWSSLMIFDMRSLRALFSDRLRDSILFYSRSMCFVATADPKAARWHSNVAALPGNVVGVDVGRAGVWHHSCCRSHEELQMNWWTWNCTSMFVSMLWFTCKSQLSRMVCKTTSPAWPRGHDNMCTRNFAGEDTSTWPKHAKTISNELLVYAYVDVLHIFVWLCIIHAKIHGYKTI